MGIHILTHVGLPSLFIREEALLRWVINGKVKHSCDSKIIVLCGLETNPPSLKHFVVSSWLLVAILL